MKSVLAAQITPEILDRSVGLQVAGGQYAIATKVPLCVAKVAKGSYVDGRATGDQMDAKRSNLPLGHNTIEIRILDFE